MNRNNTGFDEAALREAASVGDVAACQRYLRSCRCVRFSHDSKGRSALHLAVIGGHTAVIQFLLTVAAAKEINTPDGTGYTPLQLAASEGHEEVIRLLLVRGADVNAIDNTYGNSALHEASWKGYSRSVRLLLTGKTNLNKFNYAGFTALHLCCQNGHNQSCRELLLAGSSPDIQNNYGDTSLHTAVRYGHAGVTRILISANCKVSAKNKNGDTALHIAAAMGRRKLTKILLEAGCDTTVQNKQGETPKDIALRKNLNEVLYVIDNFNEKQYKKLKKHSSDGKPIQSFAYIRKEKHWSPYGCHYYPNPEVIPCPRLNSLPQEPLKHGEQYYLDLAGNICKGPVGVGYTCYCAPLFKNLKIRMERDKREFQRAQLKLDQRVTNLEHLIQRNLHRKKKAKCSFTRCRSLEIMDSIDKPLMHNARSLDNVEYSNGIERFEDKPQPIMNHENNSSENSEEEYSFQNRESKSDDTILRFSSVSNCDVFSTSALPRHRGGVYSPSVNNTSDKNSVYKNNMIKIKDTKTVNDKLSINPNISTYGCIFKPEAKYAGCHLSNDGTESTSNQYEYNLTSKLAKLRVLDNFKINGMQSDRKCTKKDLDFVASHLQDSADRDTNNDSGYSTKVYGSSKGNSPNLSGQLENECIGASSLV